MPIRSRVTAIVPGRVRARLRRGLPRFGLLRAARSSSWDEPRTAHLLIDLEMALRSGSGSPRLAVLTRPGSPDWARLVQSVHPDARIVCVPADADAETIHVQLAAVGRLDALVDDTIEGVARVGVLQDVFLHLRRGGTLLVRRPPGEHEGWAGVTSAAARGRREGLQWKAIPGAVGPVWTRRTHVVLTNERTAVAKLREHELDRVMEARGGAGMQELVRLPALTFESRCELVENSGTRSPDMPERYQVPAMSLRRYDDVICLPRQIAIQDNLALPDTFRFNAAPQLRNRFLTDLGPRFAAAPSRKARRLRGVYFYLGSEWTRHFGHAMTEQLSRMWAVRQAKEMHPDIKLLLDRRSGRTGLTSYERLIFGAAGFDESDIVLHHRPVRVDQLLAASPMWALPTHVHPDIVELWRDAGRRIEEQDDQARGRSSRIFVSRRSERRGCRNLEEVEQLFRSYGFDVLYPEDLPLPSQVAMFRAADVIAGFAGSGMLNAQFAASPRDVIVLGPTSYPSRNEYMICAAAGHRLTYVWSQPDAEELESQEARHAGFTFDMADEGQFLGGVLDDLGTTRPRG